jgi:ArsR family transcriptional regulator
MLGHPVRIRVLELLQDGLKPTCDLLAEIDIEPSSLSQQLAVLRRNRQPTAGEASSFASAGWPAGIMPGQLSKGYGP